MSIKGKYVRLEKTGVSNSPFVSTPDVVQYKYGEENKGTSVPKGYWVTGVLCADVEVGKPIVVARDYRNGVKAVGTFISSPVKEIDGNVITTDNSIYVLS